jgi:uncharacterized protein (DUF1330 family)
VPALLILNYDVHDEPALLAYRQVAGPMLTGPGGGERVATTAETVDLGEAGPAGTHTVVLRFPSVEAARQAYEAPEYQAVIGDRITATTPRVAMIVPTLD